MGDTAQLLPPGSFGQPSADATSRYRLGDLLLMEGLITKPQLDAALKIQQELNLPTPLGQILVHWKLITQQQLSIVLTKHRKTYRLGDILVESRVISEEQLESALRHQQETGMRLGEALLDLGSITEEQLKRALSQQLGVGFLDLDSLIIDRALTRWINPSYARRHRVIPLSKDEHTLTVALEDPTKSAMIEDLAPLTGCKVAVVTSTRSAFLRAFARIYDQALEGQPAPAPPQERQGVAQPAETPKAPKDPLDAQELVQLRLAYETLVRQRETDLLLIREQETLNESNKRLIEELRTAHDEVQRAHDATARTLRELQERHDALAHNQSTAVTEIEGIVRRLRSSQ